MYLPPGVTPTDFAAAISHFETVAGKEWVFTKDEDVDLYKDSFSPFLGEPEERVASAAVAPDSVEQVQQIVAVLFLASADSSFMVGHALLVDGVTAQ